MRTGRLLLYTDQTVQYPLVDGISFDKKYLLNPRFRIRAEPSRILLYSYDTALGRLSGGYHFLHPRTAILLALMDGKRTFEEVAEAFSFVMCDDVPEDVSKTGLRNLVEKLQEYNRDIIVEPRGAVLEQLNRPSPSDFVIDSSQIDLETFNPRLAFPLTVSFHLNLECNRGCIYCYAPSHTPERPHMPVSRYIELFDEVKAKQAGEIQFAGADALLNPNIVPITAAALERGYDPFLSTKQYVSPELASAFADIGLPFMQVSLDSADPQIAAHLTACSGYRDIAYRSIANLQNAGIKVRVKAVATSLNIDGIPELARELGRRNIDSLMVDAYGRSVFRHNDGLFPSNEAIASCLEKVEEARREFPAMTVMASLEPYYEQSKSERAAKWGGRAACSAGRSSLTIMTDGTVLTCDQVPVAAEFLHGSVKEMSIEEVWNSPAVQHLVYPQQSALDEPCRSCGDYLTCCNEGGRCLRDVYIAFGNASSGDPKCPRIDIAARY